MTHDDLKARIVSLAEEASRGDEQNERIAVALQRVAFAMDVPGMEAAMCSIIRSRYQRLLELRAGYECEATGEVSEFVRSELQVLQEEISAHTITLHVTDDEPYSMKQVKSNILYEWPPEITDREPDQEPDGARAGAQNELIKTGLEEDNSNDPRSRAQII